jgi:preprotein translocase subunit SecG
VREPFLFNFYFSFKKQKDMSQEEAPLVEGGEEKISKRYSKVFEFFFFLICLGVSELKRRAKAAQKEAAKAEKEKNLENQPKKSNVVLDPRVYFFFLLMNFKIFIFLVDVL